MELPESEFPPDLIPESKEQQEYARKLYQKTFGGK
jgi:hypothetical protein